MIFATRSTLTYRTENDLREIYVHAVSSYAVMLFTVREQQCTSMIVVKRRSKRGAAWHTYLITLTRYLTRRINYRSLIPVQDDSEQRLRSNEETMAALVGFSAAGSRVRCIRSADFPISLSLSFSRPLLLHASVSCSRDSYVIA